MMFLLVLPVMVFVRVIAVLDVTIEDFGEPSQSAPAGLETFLAPGVREVGAD